MQKQIHVCCMWLSISPLSFSLSLCTFHGFVLFVAISKPCLLYADCMSASKQHKVKLYIENFIRSKASATLLRHRCRSLVSFNFPWIANNEQTVHTQHRQVQNDCRCFRFCFNFKEVFKVTLGSLLVLLMLTPASIVLQRSCVSVLECGSWV